jgi:acetate kinase
VRLLAVNAGSTSVKVTVVEDGARVARFDSLDVAIAAGAAGELDGIVHRVVHGGERTEPVVLDDAEVADLTALVELAPLHQPPALEALAACRAARPDLVQVACFDTAFHTTMPAAARTYALPEPFRSTVRVYGFHGLSHSWSARRVAEQAPGARRVLVAHLGGGQSLCGVLDGRSVTTTMGFTPLDGLVMATRSGAMDPGAVVWLARHTDEDLDDLLAHRSGLAGLCGTGDMREVLARRAAGDPAASLAFDVWLHRLVALAGGCVATLGGLDALVFTGGIGEGSAEVRDRVVERLAWVGAFRTMIVEAAEDLEMGRLAGPLVEAGRR